VRLTPTAVIYSVNAYRCLHYTFEILMCKSIMDIIFNHSLSSLENASGDRKW
jgi:hypothetical protein